MRVKHYMVVAFDAIDGYNTLYCDVSSPVAPIYRKFLSEDAVNLQLEEVRNAVPFRPQMQSSK